jgi:hypothetical protein
MTLAFGATCIGIILPTFLTSGLQGVLQPYAFHASRAIEFAALPAFLQSILVGWFGSGINLTFMPTIFLALSVLPVPLTVFVRFDTFNKVLFWSILVLICFILFSRIWSPQWMLWLLPLLILTARTPRHIFCIIVYGVLNYLAFPLVYDLVGQESWLLRVVVFASYLLLIYTAVVAYRGMNETTPLPGSFVLET